MIKLFLFSNSVFASSGLLARCKDDSTLIGSTCYHMGEGLNMFKTLEETKVYCKGRGKHMISFQTKEKWTLFDSWFRTIECKLCMNLLCLLKDI